MSDWVRSLADTSEQRSRAAILAAKKRSWVEGTEMTAEELGVAWALCAAAGRADEHLEDWDREDSK
jgi:hypothetical protein